MSIAILFLFYKSKENFSVSLQAKFLKMKILVTNDDGYQAKGINILAEMMRQFGDVTVVAPKTHQSGMSMAVSLGLKPIRYKAVRHEDASSDGQKGSLDIAYLDATPASCVKFALDILYTDYLPDVVVSGINHGSNAASASCYSGTLGAAQEGALNGIPAIGVSLDSINPDADFSAVEQYFPTIFKKIMEIAAVGKTRRNEIQLKEKNGIYYNVNFPDLPADKLKGTRAGYQGDGHWVKEFIGWDPDFYIRHGVTPELLGQVSTPECEEGEKLYMMAGTFIDDSKDEPRADHHIMQDGYISIVAHNIDTTDYDAVAALDKLGFDTEFQHK